MGKEFIFTVTRPRVHSSWPNKPNKEGETPAEAMVRAYLEMCRLFGVVRLMESYEVRGNDNYQTQETIISGIREKETKDVKKMLLKEVDGVSFPESVSAKKYEFVIPKGDPDSFYKVKL